ncbi:hypothetical protein EN877_33595, partial [Mesorhizobium sp. M1D.F.Ca.ET.234.01.1.1]
MKPLATESKAASAPAPKSTSPDNAVELAYWATIEDSTDKSFFEAYLQQFPDGVFASLARLKISAIDKRTETERQVAQLPEAERATKATDDYKG